MNNKNLPIQFVETRGERDLFLKEGMGDNSLPAWSTEESLVAHAGIMENTFSGVDRIFDAREEEGLPILMVATLDKRAATSTLPAIPTPTKTGGHALMPRSTIVSKMYCTMPS